MTVHNVNSRKQISSGADEGRSQLHGQDEHTGKFSLQAKVENIFSSSVLHFTD